MKKLITVIVLTLLVTYNPTTIKNDLLASNNPVKEVSSRTKTVPKGFVLPNLGTFKITQYTAGYESTGKTPNHPLYGVTATGNIVKPKHTIASDWGVLPPGTKVKIEGFDVVFTVEDKGGAVDGKHIDMYVKSLNKALKWGVRKREVRLVEWGN